MKLGPEARMLVAAGRSAERPTTADRERVLSGLRHRIDQTKQSPSEAPSAVTYTRELRRAARP